MIEVVHYVGDDGADYFDRWLRRQSADTRARIQTRIDRIEFGNLGDHRSVGKGVVELRIHFGPGYRVYFGRDGDALVILLGAGSKRRQSRDIEAAQFRWGSYQQEKRDARETP